MMWKLSWVMVELICGQGKVCTAKVCGNLLNSPLEITEKKENPGKSGGLLHDQTSISPRGASAP